MSKHKLRVLFNTPDSKLHGGPPTHLPLLEKELCKQVDLHLFDYGRKTDSETIFDKLLGRTKDLIALRSKIQTFRPNIIHHNTAFDSIAVIRDAPLLWLAKRHRVPVFLKMHGSLNELLGKVSPLLQQLRDSILRNAGGIGVLSQIEKEQYVNAWPFLDNRVSVVKNIIKPEFHAIKRQEANVPTLLFISRFIREKGVFDLLDAIPGVLKRFPTSQFLFIGSGSDTAEFDSKVTEKKLTQYAQRIDHIRNFETVPYYASAWALVFPTRRQQEGMPMVVAEAMAAGVPIITTETKFSRSYMADEKHCLFIDYNSPLSIEKAVIHLLAQPGKRSQMSENNRALAESFKAEIVTREFIHIYEKILMLAY